jgi:hypothetical protein
MMLGRGGRRHAERHEQDGKKQQQPADERHDSHLGFPARGFQPFEYRAIGSIIAVAARGEVLE